MSLITRLFEYVTGSTPHGHPTISTKEAAQIADRVRAIADLMEREETADELERAADAIMALLGERIWQPIASADKSLPDEILVCTLGEPACVAIWLNYDHREPGWYSPTYGEHEAYGPIYPTHWRPMPR